MAGSRKRITILGIDPGLNFTGYAIVSGTVEPGKVSRITIKRLGIIRPAWSGQPGSVDKVKAMMSAVLEELPKRNLNIADYNIVEFQQKYPKQKEFHYVNPNDLIRIGYISATAAVATDLENTIFVLPRIWTKGCPKDKNHDRIKAKINKPFEQWPWDAKEANQRAIKDGLDAVGLAIWGLEEIARAWNCGKLKVDK
jgi:hypothetical protein